MIKQLLIILLFPFLLFSQSNSDCGKEINLSDGNKYFGCTDVEGRFNGKGKYLLADGSYYSGDWVNNKREGSGKFKSSEGSLYIGDWVNNKMDGKGKYTTTDGDIYEGYYKDNMRNGQGVYSYKIGSQKSVESGVFKNDMFFTGTKTSNLGKGITIESEFMNGERVSLLQISSDFKIESSGSYFSNGTLKSGTQKTFLNDGEVIIAKFDNGDEIIGSQKSNVKNYYIESDIEGNLESNIIDLEFDENDNTKYVNLNFLTINKKETENFRFIFDTGAEMFSIGYNLFNKLKENGLDYVDLGIVKESVGIRGEPIQNKVIRIKELSIGQYKVKNVIAFVKTLETANSSLLGIGFLKKFSEAQWSLISNQLTLYK
jgi:hypothetical protein